MAVYLRGAGGFSTLSRPYSFIKYPSSQNLSYKIPKTQPFAVFEECTQPSQALLYRLSGDCIPLPSDPVVTEIAGVLYQVKVRERNKAALSGLSKSEFVSLIPPKTLVRGFHLAYGPAL